jgi:hypothetical protein
MVFFLEFGEVFVAVNGQCLADVIPMNHCVDEPRQGRAPPRPEELSITDIPSHPPLSLPPWPHGSVAFVRLLRGSQPNVVTRFSAFAQPLNCIINHFDTN